MLSEATRQMLMLLEGVQTKHCRPQYSHTAHVPHRAGSAQWRRQRLPWWEPLTTLDAQLMPALARHSLLSWDWLVAFQWGVDQGELHAAA